MSVKNVATVILIVYAIIIINVWREGGAPAVRRWHAAKLMNKVPSS